MQKFIKEHKEVDIHDVDFYIMKFNSDKQERLLKIRSVVKEKYSDTTERIYYGIPTIEKNGKIIMQYAAYKNHISLLIGNFLSALLKEKYPQYNYTDYTVIFPDNKPFPDDLVKEICEVLGQLTGEDFYAKSNKKN